MHWLEHLFDLTVVFAPLYIAATVAICFERRRRPRSAWGPMLTWFGMSAALWGGMFLAREFFDKGSFGYEELLIFMLTLFVIKEMIAPVILLMVLLADVFLRRKYRDNGSKNGTS